MLMYRGSLMAPTVLTRCAFGLARNVARSSGSTGPCVSLPLSMLVLIWCPLVARASCFT